MQEIWSVLLNKYRSSLRSVKQCYFQHLFRIKARDIAIKFWLMPQVILSELRGAASYIYPHQQLYY